MCPSQGHAKWRDTPFPHWLQSLMLPVSMQKTLFQAASMMLSFGIGYGLNVIRDLTELFRLAHSAEE